MALARWKDLCIDATDAHRMARFWGELLGLEIELHDDGDGAVRGSRPEETIWINAVPEPRTVKQRVHLDLEAPSLEPILELGATMLRPASESGFRWSVLADPEGGELCVFVREVFEHYATARLCELVVDTADAATAHAQATWWAEVLGAVVVDDERGFSWVQEVPGLPFDSIDFIPVPETKSVKNRVHWDITCHDVPALVDRGARVLAEHPDWTVVADPDGNEFCVF